MNQGEKSQVRKPDHTADSVYKLRIAKMFFMKFFIADTSFALGYHCIGEPKA